VSPDRRLERLQQLLGLDVERAEARQELLVAELDVSTVTSPAKNKSFPQSLRRLKTI
jgi:hypothetical protein